MAEGRRFDVSGSLHVKYCGDAPERGRRVRVGECVRVRHVADPARVRQRALQNHVVGHQRSAHVDGASERTRQLVRRHEGRAAAALVPVPARDDLPEQDVSASRVRRHRVHGLPQDAPSAAARAALAAGLLPAADAAALQVRSAVPNMPERANLRLFPIHQGRREKGESEIGIML